MTDPFTAPPSDSKDPETRLDEDNASLDSIHGRGGPNVVAWIVACVVGTGLGAVVAFAFWPTGTPDLPVQVAAVVAATEPETATTDVKAKLTAAVEQNSIAGSPFVSSPRLCEAVTFTQFVKSADGQPGKLRSVVACLDRAPFFAGK